MRRLPLAPRLPLVLAFTALAVILPACSDQAGEPPTGPQLSTDRPPPPGLEAALRAQERHTVRLLATPGIIGTGVGLNRAGHAVVRLYVERPGLGGIPSELDRVPVEVEVTGRIYARIDPTKRIRPAPIGVSVGHPSITAGTLGARVLEGSGVYILSNNHVLAAVNGSLGAATLQPGPIDGGTTANDQIGTLFEYEPLKLGSNCYGCTYPTNYMDAAVASVTAPGDVISATPDDGYGVPNSTVYGNDGDGDGLIDSTSALLLLNVQKYGRTTRLTHGQVREVNVTIDVCYDIFCLTVGRFKDQYGICCSGFSDGGDSGSLIVSDDSDRKLVGLLFAGGGTRTYANRIDRVLTRFGVTVDGSAPPATPVTDIAVTGVSAPASATIGDQVPVGVQVLNTGNQDVTSIPVELLDQTANQVIGTETITSLAAGASTTVNFTWNTTGASSGDHTLVGSHSTADDDGSNNSSSTVVTLNQTPAGGMHVGDLEGSGTTQSRSWTATIEITVHDGSHGAVAGATVTGAFSNGGTGTRNCTTGPGGICTVTRAKLRGSSVTFTVTSVTHATLAYVSGANHDADGDSNGTVIVVPRPSP